MGLTFQFLSPNLHYDIYKSTLITGSASGYGEAEVLRMITLNLTTYIAKKINFPP